MPYIGAERIRSFSDLDLRRKTPQRSGEKGNRSSETNEQINHGIWSYNHQQLDRSPAGSFSKPFQRCLEGLA